MTRALPTRAAARATIAAMLGLAVLIGCTTQAAVPSGTPVVTPTPTPTPKPTPKPTPTPTPTPVPTPTPIPLNQAMLNERFTVLIAGQDSDRWREARGMSAWNTDALMVVSVSADRSQITMLSLPRDIVDVPMADGRVYGRKINSMMSAFGLPTLKSAVATLLGIEIDHYVKIDMDDFPRLVNVVGGVDVVVQTHVWDRKLPINLRPGPAHLTGAMATYYSRTRTDSDYARAARQQQVVLALARKFADPAVEWSLAEVLPLITALETDFDLADMPTLLEIGRRSANAKVTQTVLSPPRFALFSGIEPGTGRGWVMIPNVAEMRAYARALIN